MRALTMLPVCLWIHVSAQPVYETPVSAGQEFQILRLIGSSPILQLASGENQIWDLSTLASGVAYNSSFGDATDSDVHDEFPEATIFRVLGTDEEHYAISGGDVDIVGELLGGDARTFSNPARLMVTPFSYGDSWTDQFTETWTTSGIDFVSTGSLTSEVVGYGSVALPGGDFEDALFVHERQDIVFSQDGDANDVTRYIDRVWVNGLSQPLVQSTRTVQMYGNDTIGDSYRVYYVQSILASVEGQSTEAVILSAAPNPCSEGTTVRSMNDTRFGSCTLHDASGRLIKELDRIGPRGTWLETSQFSAGIYMLCATRKDGSTTAVRLSVVH